MHTDIQLGLASVLLISLVSVTAGLSSTSNTAAPSGSLWIEGSSLRWANGSTEYWIAGGGSKRIGEGGSKSNLNDATSYSVSFSQAFTETPLVFATTQTTGGAQDPSQAHTWSVDTSGFTTQHCEYEGGDLCDSHAAETNGYVAINPSNVKSLDGMDAGTVSVSNDNTASVSFNENFDSTPLVFTQIQTRNENQNARTSRIGNKDTTGFDLKLCEQETTDGCDSSHSSETIAWWAIDPSTASKGDAFDWGTVSQSDSNWNSVSFSQSYSSTPVLIGTLQTLTGEDAHYIEADNVGTSNGDIRFCESDGGDGCDTHGTRTLAWLSVSQSVINRNLGSASVVDDSSPAPLGSLWVESSALHWVDADGDEMEYQGTDTGNNPSSANLGNLWMESGMLHYIDANGDERKTTSGGSTGGSSNIIDDFEDGDLGEYSDDGSSNVWSIESSSPIYNGDYSMKVSPNDGWNIYHRNADFSAGDKAKVYFYPTVDGSGNSGFAFAHSGSSSYYLVTIKTWADSLEIFQDEKTSNGKLGQTSCSVGQDQWYELVVDWGGSGSIDLTLNDAGSGSQVCSLSVTDSTYTSGDIGFANSGNYVHYWDYAYKP